MNRRTLLVTGMASAVVLGLGGMRLMRDAPEAREPWTRAGESFGDPRLDSLAYAILAPNAHNLQPWIFELSGSDTVIVRADPNRMLPETDPPARQITISFGAMLELLRMAARAKGYAVAVDPFPQGEPYPLLDDRPVAHVRFSPDEAQVDPLMDQLLSRRTNKSVFSDKAVSRDAVDMILSEAGDRAGMASDTDALKALCRDGWAIESALKRTHRESLDVTRIGAREVAANPDGISLYGPVMEAMALGGMMNREAMADPTSRAGQASLDFYNGLINSARHFLWLRSDGNSRVDQLAAGRDWVRMNMAATRAGVAFHPLSQVLQEFPEMSAQFDAAHRLTGQPVPDGALAGRLQGLFRIGYAKVPKPAPRWPLRSRLVGTS